MRRPNYQTTTDTGVLTWRRQRDARLDTHIGVAPRGDHAAKARSTTYPSSAADAPSRAWTDNPCITLT